MVNYLLLYSGGSMPASETEQKQVMEAWGKAHDVGDKILLLADGSGDFTRAMDLVMDGTGFGLGLRSKRYAAVIEDGIITQLNVEETGGISVSSCESVLASL